MIQEEQRATAANHEEILMPLVLKVGEESARGIIEYTDSGFFCYIFKCSIAPVTVKPIWQASRLADIEIVETVIIEIARCHAIVTVNINAASSVENRPPIIDAVKHLVRVRLHAPESLGGNVNEHWPMGDA